MRNLKLFLALVGCILFVTADAQIELELKTGLSNSRASIDGVSSSIKPSTLSKTAGTIGLGIGYQLDNHFTVGTGVDFRRQGFNIKEGTSFNLAGIDVPVGVEFRFNESLINIPLFIKYAYKTPVADIYLKSGISAGVGLGGNYQTVANSFINFTLTDDQINYGGRIKSLTANWDIGVGAAFNYGTGKITTELGYQKGLKDKINDSMFDMNARYDVVQLTVGYIVSF